MLLVCEPTTWACIVGTYPEKTKARLETRGLYTKYIVSSSCPYIMGQFICVGQVISYIYMCCFFFPLFTEKMIQVKNERKMLPLCMSFCLSPDRNERDVTIAAWLQLSSLENPSMKPMVFVHHRCPILVSWPWQLSLSFAAPTPGPSVHFQQKQTRHEQLATMNCEK